MIAPVKLWPRFRAKIAGRHVPVPDPEARPGLHSPGADPLSARDPWFDNAKIAILILVVAGHVIEHWTATSAFWSAIYTVIYLFHMPAIIVISGAFSARMAARGRNLDQAARFLLIFVLAQAAFAPAYQYLVGVPVVVFFSTPVFALWFLPALAAWILLAPAILRLPYAIPLSVVVAVAVGYVPEIGAKWSLSRILVFLPFFLAGWKLGTDGLRLGRLARPNALAILATSLVAGLVLAGATGGGLLYRGSMSFAELGLSGPGAGLARLAHLLLAAAAVAAFLALIPRRRLPISDWGSRTLEIYLFHSVAIYSARLSGVLPAEPTLHALGVGLALVAGTLWASTRPGLSDALRPVLRPAR